MILTVDDLRELAQGTEEVFCEGGYTVLARFNRAERELYEKTEFRLKSSATSAVQLVFKTDAEAMRLKVNLSCYALSHSYFNIDVFVDDVYFDSMGNIAEDEADIYQTFEMGEFEKEFTFEKGEKTVRIVFPGTCTAQIAELSLHGASFAQPVKRNKKMLAYGDSITQGYEAVHPSNAYVVKLAHALDAEVINKAIGGEIFFPPLSEIKSSITPDYITVAYGTNDWGRTTPDIFRANCRAFYVNIAKHYPSAKIFALTPIWRRDFEESRPFGSFLEIARIIKEETADIPNVTLIDGFDLVPHDSTYFADLRLHPNDQGFLHYAENLEKALRPFL